MIVRKIEICPDCGQQYPWRRYASHEVQGQRRIYVKCRRCGRKDVIVYMPPSPAVEKKITPNG